MVRRTRATARERRRRSRDRDRLQGNRSLEWAAPRGGRRRGCRPGALLLHRGAPARGLPDLEPDVGRRVSPDPPLHAVPEDPDEGVFEVSGVGNARSGVLDAGPPSLADLTPGEQMEAPPSRPRDDGLDPLRRVACHFRTPQCPRPRRRIEKQAGRSATATTTCTGSRSPPSGSAAPRWGASMLLHGSGRAPSCPTTARHPGLLDTHHDLGPTRPSAQEPRRPTMASWRGGTG